MCVNFALYQTSDYQRTKFVKILVIRGQQPFYTRLISFSGTVFILGIISL